MSEYAMSFEGKGPVGFDALRPLPPLIAWLATHRSMMEARRFFFGKRSLNGVLFKVLQRSLHVFQQ